ncbi:hypothetical protein HAZT_HAZT001854 [Hyalella azteca]|uniref:Mitoferrin-1 n=1 Tax=Hyalella azteca TaxID=294128 RepID=A0A6A0GVE9_HYAAZ|nr:mitoferrin-1 [Hyalella azteca]KAA0189590.1 hypothetical protein HAZT_HAZT001854 [Hyalella azteca]
MEFDDYEKLNDDRIGVVMCAGALAGIFEHIVMYPIDSVKTRMQCLAPSPEASYHNVRDGLSKMITNEGIWRPVRGVNAVIMGAGPAHALYFSAIEGIKKNIGSKNYINDHAANAAAGCGATLLHDAVMVPADAIKQRLQMYNSPYSSCFNCAQQLYRTEGIRAFYRSYTTQLMMNLPNHAILLVVYEKMQKLFNPSREYNAPVHCAAGAVAGAIGAAVTTPLDVCKTLLNTQETSTLNQIRASRISGVRNALRTIYVMGGFKGFFKGLQARVLFQMPSTAISWTVYELFKHSLRQDRNDDCNPENGNELLMDGVVGEMPPLSASERAGGGGGKTGLVLQEKKYGGLGAAGTVERLRTLHVGSSLTATCSAAGPADENFLVK